MIRLPRVGSNANPRSVGLRLLLLFEIVKLCLLPAPNTIFHQFVDEQYPSEYRYDDNELLILHTMGLPNVRKTHHLRKAFSPHGLNFLKMAVAL